MSSEDLVQKMLGAVRKQDEEEFHMYLAETDSMPEDMRKEILNVALNDFYLGLVVNEYGLINKELYRCVYNDNSFLKYLEQLFDKGASLYAHCRPGQGFPYGMLLQALSDRPDLCADLTKCLVKHGLNLDDERNIYTAIKKAMPDTVKVLLEAGVSPNIKIITTHRRYAYLKGPKWNVLNYALFCSSSSSPANENLPDWKDSLEIVRLLLEAGADPNGTHGIDPPIFAVNDVETASLLMRYKPDLSKYNHSGSTVLGYRINENDLNIAKFFLDHGADPNERDSCGMTPAFFVKSVKAVSLLAEYGANFNLECSSGATPLSYVDSSVEDAVIGKLIKSGADVNLKNSSGRTALHILTDKSQLLLSGTCEKIRRLIEYGADVNITDNSGITPFLNFILSTEMLTKNKISSEYEDLAVFMVERGAEIYVEDIAGHSIPQSGGSAAIQRLRKMYEHIFAVKNTIEEDINEFER